VEWNQQTWGFFFLLVIWFNVIWRGQLCHFRDGSRTLLSPKARDKFTVRGIELRKLVTCVSATCLNSTTLLFIFLLFIIIIFLAFHNNNNNKRERERERERKKRPIVLL